MDPKSAESKTVPQSASADLARLGDLEVKFAGAEGVAARLRKELKPLSTYVRWGALRRDGSGAWTCVPVAVGPSAPQGALLVAVPHEGGAELREIGSSTSDGIKFAAEDPKLLVEGRPVWFAVE
jgi:hypothetical protein